MCLAVCFGRVVAAAFVILVCSLRRNADEGLKGVCLMLV